MWSGRRDSNPRPQPWQGCALPAEPRPREPDTIPAKAPKSAEVGRRLKELEGPYKLAQQWKAAREDLAAARDDAELKDLVAELEERTARLEEELRLAMVQSDPADHKDVILEVRQGVGGDEAALWAGDVYRMLTRYAERRGFKVEELSGDPLRATPKHFLASQRGKQSLAVNLKTEAGQEIVRTIGFRLDRRAQPVSSRNIAQSSQGLSHPSPPSRA